MIFIIQARLSSKRLPNKVLKKINNKELLMYIPFILNPDSLKPCERPPQPEKKSLTDRISSYKSRIKKSKR